MKECSSLQEVRDNIDGTDRKIVTLLAERGTYVRQAARFKKDESEVSAPSRVAQVMAKVNALALEVGANRWVVEQVYRAMTSAFIAVEMEEHKKKEKEKL
jgi:isochorismate pyruvate lyase